MDGLLPFFKLRDELEPKFVEAAGKGAEGAKVEVKSALVSGNEKRLASLLELGKNMSSRFNYQKNDLRWDLRSLPSSALTGSQLLELVTKLPERILNFLSYLRIYFISKAPEVFDHSLKEGEVERNFRQFFVNCLCGILDPLFEGIWNLLTTRLNAAIRLTTIFQLKKPILEVLQGLVEGLKSLVPEALSSFINVSELIDNVMDSLLGAIADKVFAHYKKKIELHIFAEAEKSTKEEMDAMEDKIRKEKEERDKKEKEKAAFDNP